LSSGNQGLGVTWGKITAGVREAVEVAGGRALVFGGKMHSRGVEKVQSFL